MKNKSFFYVALMALLAGALASCRKDKENLFDASNMTNESVSSFVEKTVSADEDAVSLKSMQGGGGENCNWQNLLAECVVVTVSSEEFPKTITIDYGDGCTNSNGVTKSGQIIINLSDDMINQGAVRVVTFQDFVVNEVEVSGSRTCTNTGTNDAGNPVFSRTVGVNITYDGETIQRDFNHVVTWLSGYVTPECGDNIFEITGSGSVTRPDGTVVTRTIIEPLIMDRICGHIISGVIEVNVPQGIATIDFGNGTCDDIAVVTSPDGETHIIHIN
ncbi:MAG: hypothetical protein SH856_15005 [Flavobacteriales bacterium]|nr:hypothetical protein [Flavobacteriales bacterium]